MTEKQRNLILYLDSLCKEKGLTIRANSDDMLGKEWFSHYKNYTPDYTNKVITKLKEAVGLPTNTKRRTGR